MKKVYIRITLIIASAAIIFAAICLIKYFMQDSVMGVKYTELELNRTEIYLREGCSYPLKLEPNNLSHVIYEEEFQEALGSKPRWKSSDESVVTVSKKGVVTAAAPGSAIVTVKMRGVDCSCKVNSLPKNEDTEIPIRYCNDVFNQELYEQIESIQIFPTYLVTGEITSKYVISTLYSLLAELEKMEKIPDEYEMRYGGYGIRLHLKDGKMVDVGLAGGDEIIVSSGDETNFDSAWYSCQYGAQSSYGKGYNHTDEMYHIVEMIKQTM